MGTHNVHQLIHQASPDGHGDDAWSDNLAWRSYSAQRFSHSCASNCGAAIPSAKQPRTRIADTRETLYSLLLTASRTFTLNNRYSHLVQFELFFVSILSFFISVPLRDARAQDPFSFPESDQRLTFLGIRVVHRCSWNHRNFICYSTAARTATFSDQRWRTPCGGHAPQQWKA